MFKRIFAYFQYILPQHLLTSLIGWLADLRIPWVKNFLIKQFICLYKINMQEAADENPENYACFNDFFTRQLKTNIRPIAAGENTIASPADGTVAMLGRIQKNQLLQAKNMYFDLDTLLADESLAQTFYDGTFSTIYLAPYNYHRVHMPFSGKLMKTIYVPGKLFSVNRMTSEVIPHLYSRNERLICLFDTAAGPMIVILVGALIVGGIKTIWMQDAIRANKVITESFDGLNIEKGAELGLFNMGSTVIVLFTKNTAEWSANLTSYAKIEFGQEMGNILK